MKIYVDDATDVDADHHLHYRVSNGLKFFEDHDELYWNVTGDEWDVPIENASAQIFLPPGRDRRSDQRIHRIVRLARAGRECRRRRTTTWKCPWQRPLAFHEGLTVVVGWDKGFVNAAGHGRTDRPISRQQLAALFPDARVPVHVLAVVHARARSARRPDRRAVRAARRDDARPKPERWWMTTRRMRDITATIVDLAVRGYLVIEEKEKSHMMGLLHNKEYVFHLKKKPDGMGRPEGARIAAARGDFLERRASRRGAFQLCKISSTRICPASRTAFSTRLMERGYFQHRPDYVRSGFVSGRIRRRRAAAVLWATRLSQTMGMAPAPFLVAAFLSGWNHRRIRLVHAGAHGRRERKRSRACWASRIF